MVARSSWLGLVVVAVLTAGCDTVLGFPDPFAGIDAAAPGDAGSADAAVALDAPAPVDGGAGLSVASVAAGGAHTCAVLTDGRVRCWGSGASGRLGYGNLLSVGDDEPPRDAGFVEVGGAVRGIALGTAHTCAVRTDAAVVCWGEGGEGQLGYGNVASVGGAATPASAGAVNLGIGATQVVAGGAHTCALTTTGAVRCWGRAAAGQLGYGSINVIGDNEAPSTAGDVSLGGVVVTQLAAGQAHTCALTSEGRVMCWGNGSDGRLGYGNVANVGDGETPASVGSVDAGGTVMAIAAARNFTCALLADGHVRCWGAALLGQLGNGQTASIGDTEQPGAPDIPDTGITGASAIAAGGDHACALVGTSVRCWGLGGSGQLGIGGTSTIGDDERAIDGPGVVVGAPVAAITVGVRHTCALLATGAVRCWGLGDDGRLGYGDVQTIGDTELPSTAGDVPVL